MIPLARRRGHDERGPLPAPRRDPQDLRHVPGAQGDRSRDRAGRVRLLPRAFGLRQDDAAAHHRRPRDADRGPDPAGRARHLGAAAGRARLRHRLPVVCAVPQPDVADNVAYGLVNRKVAKAAARGARRRAAEAGRPARQRRQVSRPSFRAASSSASRWRARSPPSPACCCSTSRSRRSMRSSACACARRSARCSDKLGVTTIMVTHDQEEALSVADRIVVMNHGVIEQVGTPMQIYREPATAVRRRFRRQDQRAVGPWSIPGGDLRIGTSRFACAHDTEAERDGHRSTCARRTCSRGRSHPATRTCSTARSTRSNSSARTAWCA